MNNIDYVSTLLESMIQQGASKPDIVRAVGKACIGWPYVFGAWGEECTPEGRKRRKRDAHPTIVTACQVLNGKKSTCDGCKWYPGGVRVRMFDCRGFTYWVLKQVGIKIDGQGCSSQWSTNTNWTVKGSISEMPRDRVCCVFTGTEKTKEHTGLYLGDGSTVECSSGVQFFDPMKSKWTWYAIPAGLYDDTPIPPSPTPTKPTLRRGDSGEYVTLAQVELIQKGYSCGSFGADGKFGAGTEKAVREFQRDHTDETGNPLKVDGIIGQKTWAALDSSEPAIKYTVTIPHLSTSQADALLLQYPEGTKTEERGEVPCL